MFLVLVLWALLIVSGARRKKNDEPVLEARQATAIRGICAVEIMLGHIGLATGYPALYPNRKAGILFVGVFLMLSGYGVAYSVAHKENYLSHFLRKKFIRLMLPAYLAFFTGEVVSIVLFQHTEWSILINLKYFLRTLNWYVWEQLFFYIIFYFIYKIMPDKINWIMAVISIIFIGAGFSLKIDNPWYGSTLCFVFGLIYYKYSEKMQKWFYENFRLLLFIYSGILGVSISAFFFLGNESILGNPVARNVAALSFCILVVIILGKVKVGNSISYFLGECSYELYLIHSFVISMLLRMQVNSASIFCWLTIGISIILSWIIHYIVAKVFHKTVK